MSPELETHSVLEKARIRQNVNIGVCLSGNN